MSNLTADRFQVRILDEGSHHYEIRFPYGDNRLQTPTLNAFIERWRDQSGEPFPPADLTPKRLGMCTHGKNPFRDVYTLNCTSLSWAQVALMDDDAVAEKIPQQEQFTVVGIGCTIYTTDGKIIITRRAGPDKMKQAPHMRHVVGGYADLESTVETQSLLPTVYEELGEEAGISKKDISMLIPIGAYESLMPGVPGVHVGFFARVLLTANEVLQRAKNAKNAYEGKLSPYTPEELRKLLEEADDFVPTAAAALVRIVNTEPWKKYSCTRCRKEVAPENTPQRLIIVRHGETNWNLRNLSVGSKDIPLNDAGRKQAEAHAQKLMDIGIPINAIICSPLSRAKETARIIANMLGIEDIAIDSRLRERCVGTQEGKPNLEKWWNFFTDEFLPEHAEPYPEFQKRIAEVLINVTLASGNVLAVNHGFVMVEIMKQIYEWPAGHLPNIRIPSHEEELIFGFGNRCSCRNRWFEQF